MNSKTPDLDCVTVSTAETPVVPGDCGLSTTPSGSGFLVSRRSEKELIRHLVVTGGWHWLDAGVLQRPWTRKPLPFTDVVAIKRLLNTYEWRWLEPGVLARPWARKEVS